MVYQNDLLHDMFLTLNHCCATDFSASTPSSGFPLLTNTLEEASPTASSNVTGRVAICTAIY